MSAPTPTSTGGGRDQKPPPVPTTGYAPDTGVAGRVGSGGPTADRAPQRPGDRVFSGLSLAAGVLILLVLAGVGLFLLLESLPALTADPEQIPGGEGFLAYLRPVLLGTLLIAALALLIAFPFSVAIALYISHYAPRRVSRTLGYVVDLLAAIPSVVYGLWGFATVAPFVTPLYRWLGANLGFLPFFEAPVSATGRTVLTAGIVLAIMILPIMSAINREVFLQTPTLHEEASLALGATRWEMIRMAVLPYARSGIISGAMLGLGRALGETIAVLLVLSASGAFSLNLIGRSNPPTIPSNIASNFPEATGITLNTLIATGLVLFVVTFLVNFIARAVIARRAAFDGASG